MPISAAASANKLNEVGEQNFYIAKQFAFLLISRNVFSLFASEEFLLKLALMFSPFASFSSWVQRKNPIFNISKVQDEVI